MYRDALHSRLTSISITQKRLGATPICLTTNVDNPSKDRNDDSGVAINDETSSTESDANHELEGRAISVARCEMMQGPDDRSV